MAYREDSFIAELSSSQNEYSTDWEKDTMFCVILEYYKCYICLNPSQWYFMIMCFENSFKSFQIYWDMFWWCFMCFKIWVWKCGLSYVLMSFRAWFMEMRMRYDLWDLWWVKDFMKCLLIYESDMLLKAWAWLCIKRLRSRSFLYNIM
jgi:hypothetical protein